MNGGRRRDLRSSLFVFYLKADLVHRERRQKGLGFAGSCAPSSDRRPAKNPSGLGAPGMEVEGFAGFGAPSPDRWSAENPPGLGAKETELQGFAGFGAPSPDRRPVENSAALIELSVLQTHNPICLEN